MGLRIDVDTFRGTREGVPRLLEILDSHAISATFFFSVGPDNMGRHLWRLIKPKFLLKMLRSNAASLYGWDILLAGTAWPGKLIGQRLGSVMRETDQCGHEIGLHAWDHHAWQAHTDHWDQEEQTRHIQRGVDCLNDILGRAVTCSAAAGWRADQITVDAKEAFGFRYNSDCRGRGIFQPLLSNGQAGTPQIPVDLPTFDEVVGPNLTPLEFNRFILDQFQQPNSEVYTAHAEVEGIAMADQFDQLLSECRKHGINFTSLDNLLSDRTTFHKNRIVRGSVEGREGWIGCKSDI
ncbi:4-deoxy-4-formamido-L-arabinose-phosphoundecaprenol deformylase [Marinobacter halodurans]